MKLVEVLIKCLALIGTIVSLSACAPDPQDDIPLFKQYIERNINKTSDDPYISASVKPGDALYEYLSKMQRGQGYRSILVPLIEQGNTDAMVWMGRGNSNQLELRGETIALLGRAMQAGDPFAALALSSGGEECWEFGKSSLSTSVANALGEEVPSDIETCSKENWKVAMQGFQELADDGDLRSQYFILTMKRIQQPDDSREAHEFYIKEIIRFAEGHYYQPMMDYVRPLFEKVGKHRQLTAKTPELEKMSIDLLTIAANHNYIPAINFLIEYNRQTITTDDPLFTKGIMLGSRMSLVWQFIIFNHMRESKLDPKDVYYYASIYSYITGSDDYMRMEFEDNSLNVEELSLLDAEVSKITPKITPMVYLDRFTLRTDWVER
ncbi:hypothetical protein L4C38_11750 [Vibrio kasasachensis]|uniref:hypothetical protein n=1 Tax=Vibrio kasasachensis TaxID=2910248 RepID=UPI003D0A22E9